MPENLQIRILNADGPLMKSYIRIFEEGAAMIQKAKQKFIEKSEIIIKNMTVKVKKLKKEKLRNDEVESRQDDEKSSADLLEAMNKI